MVLEQNNNIERKMAIRNLEGKKELELAYLKYCESIIKNIKENPSLIDDIVELTEENESYLFSILSGENKANITELDSILKLTMNLKNENNINEDSNKGNLCN